MTRGITADGTDLITATAGTTLGTMAVGMTLGTMAAGTTLGITDQAGAGTADGMIRGTMATADGTADGMAVGTTTLTICGVTTTSVAVPGSTPRAFPLQVPT